jgi:hypothetical protein
LNLTKRTSRGTFSKTAMQSLDEVFIPLLNFDEVLHLALPHS